MKYGRCATALVFLFTFMFALVAGAAANPQYEGRMAVVLVIDASGSMNWNDPDRVRVEAAQKTLDLLKDDDYLALVEFASAPRVIMSMRPVGGEDGRREIRDLIDQVGQRGDTDILGGLRNGYHQLTGAPADARKFVILLSDGESDVPGVTNTPWGRERYFADTEAVLAQYAQNGWPVHCIGFYEQEAGPELQNIAAKTAGEYQFVAEVDELKNIFANILLAAKYPPGVKPVFHAAFEPREAYLVGGTLAAEAYITIGEDRVLPGPYLELTGMNLVVSRPDLEPVTVPFGESAEDGLFRAEIVLEAAGDYEVLVTATARYRGHEIAESVVLGAVTAQEEVRTPLIAVDPGYVEAAFDAAAYAALAAGWLFLLLVTILLWRLRLRERVGGELRVWAETKVKHKYCKYRFRLGKARKPEVKIGTKNHGDADFKLEPDGREFAFVIRTMRDPLLDPKLSTVQRVLKGPKMLYQIIGLPGTAIQMDDKLKTRELLYDEDRFDVGGYTFEFCCSWLGKRPGGKEVLDAYATLMSGKDSKKGKGKKILTLRTRDKNVKPEERGDR